MKKYYLFFTIVALAIGAYFFFHLSSESNKTQTNSINSSFQTKTITHDFGTTELTKEPKRIVILNNLYAEVLMPLGITPIGATTAQADSSEFSTLFKKDFESANVISLGWQKSPNLEKIAELQPDLILMTTHQKDIYDKLSQIAPTIGYKMNTEENWDYTEVALKVADIFDKKEQMQNIINQVAQKQEKLANKVTETFKNQKLMYVRITDKSIRCYAYGRFGYLYETYHFNRAEEFDPANMFEIIDTEKLKELNPDLLIIQADSKELLESKLHNSPVWNQLTAVKNKKVIYADYSTYMLGFGVVSQEAIMDQISTEWGLN